MEKPYYIPFSQEIFDDCENFRFHLRTDATFKNTEEFKKTSMRLANFILSKEYGKYLHSIQTK